MRFGDFFLLMLFFVKTSNPSEGGRVICPTTRPYLLCLAALLHCLACKHKIDNNQPFCEVEIIIANYLKCDWFDKTTSVPLHFPLCMCKTIFMHNVRVKWSYETVTICWSVFIYSLHSSTKAMDSLGAQMNTLFQLTTWAALFANCHCVAPQFIAAWRLFRETKVLHHNWCLCTDCAVCGRPWNQSYGYSRSLISNYAIKHFITRP